MSDACCLTSDTRCAGVAQWKSRSLPSLRRGFDSLHPLQRRCSRTAKRGTDERDADGGAGPCSSVVEHSLGKGEVERSIRSMGTMKQQAKVQTHFRPNE